MSERVEEYQLNSHRMVAWKSLDETQFFMKFLEGIEHDLKEQWANGAYTGENTHQNVVHNCRAQGAIEQLRRILGVFDGISAPKPTEG